MRSSLLVLLAVPGCVLGTVKSVPCDASAQCRDEFGFGWQCGDAGFCEAVVPSNRCDDPYPDDLFTRPENYSDAIVLGSLFDYATSLENLLSVELAIDEANIDGGLDGREIALVNCNIAPDLDLDDRDPTTAAKDLTAWMAEAVGVPAMLGPSSSRRVQDVWPEASAAGLLVVSPSATSDALTQIDGATSTDEAPGLFWRTAPPDAIQAATVALDITARDVMEVAIIHEEGLYGQGLADGIDANLAIATTLYPYANSNDLTAAIADAGNGSATEVVFVSSEPDDVAAFLNGANASGDYATKGIFLTDAARDADVLTDAANASALFPNIRGTVPVPDPVTAALEDTFYLAYSQRYGTDAGRDGFNTFSYDAAWITLYGVAWATSQESEVSGLTIARGLRRLSDATGPEVPIRAASWSDVQESFAAGTAVDVFGASGTLDYDPTTGETSNPIAIWKVVTDGTDWSFEDEQICDVQGNCQPVP
ncbi:MAG: ABC transporter substrate-binding protein [Alphaproteobacteria bacterium]|nr:ABC transporter substrate-binding protein [Alphaproteobacteria bacterium]